MRSSTLPAAHACKNEVVTTTGSASRASFACGAVKLHKATIAPIQMIPYLILLRSSSHSPQAVRRAVFGIPLSAAFLGFRVQRLRVACIVTAAPRAHLFNHLIGTGEERGRDREAERIGCFEIENEVELGGLLDQQVLRLCTFQNLIN